MEPACKVPFTSPLCPLTLRGHERYTQWPATGPVSTDGHSWASSTDSSEYLTIKSPHAHPHWYMIPVLEVDCGCMPCSTLACSILQRCQSTLSTLFGAYRSTKQVVGSQILASLQSYRTMQTSYLCYIIANVILMNSKLDAGMKRIFNSISERRLRSL